jgi:hypothetical protein
MITTSRKGGMLLSIVLGVSLCILSQRVQSQTADSLQQVLANHYLTLRSININQYPLARIRMEQIRGENEKIIRRVGARITNISDILSSQDSIIVYSSRDSLDIFIVRVKYATSEQFYDKLFLDDELKALLETKVGEWTLRQRLMQYLREPPIEAATPQPPRSWRTLIDSGEKEHVANMVTDRDTIDARLGARMIPEGRASTPSLTIKFFEDIMIQASRSWGAELKVGNDEIGYPFWTSGNIAVQAAYCDVRLGFQFPYMGGGRTTGTLSKLLPSRGLEGTYGITGGVQMGPVGASLLYGFRRTDADSKFLDPENIYSIRLLTQLWYSFTLDFGRAENLLRVRMGAGFHLIGHDRVDPATKEVAEVETQRSFWSPYFRYDYINSQFSRNFGATLQYYKEWILGSIWIELLENFLWIEFKAAAPALRLRYPWEPSHYFWFNVPCKIPL